ncbi:hypothetical protein LUX57_21115 [Actinomadura madurae]|uniref:hypothetical protein n=1 Tax=Actinomadura madurae TaxID=1993 RepID=UPI0020D1FA7C|nr:hypothetical protein [Actinomadura madurae]MCP9967309.1 hypothetical protein [Actinomadura madurae]
MWVAVAAAGALMLGGLVVVMLLPGGDPSGPVKAGQCVDTGFGSEGSDRIPASLRVSCDDAGAKARVVKITDKGRPRASATAPAPSPTARPGRTASRTSARRRAASGTTRPASATSKDLTRATPARAAPSWRSATA